MSGCSRVCPLGAVLVAVVLNFTGFGGQQSGAADPDNMMMMKKMMMDPEMMGMARKEMMSDDKMMHMVAREMMLQHMLRDKETMMAVQKGAMKQDPEMMKMLNSEKMMMAKDGMMKDKKAMMSMMRELMVRQMAADMHAEMMKENPSGGQKQ